MTAFDLSIVGAGPVGALSALLADRAGFKVLLLDEKPAAPTFALEAPVDLRVIALAPGSRALIELLDAWPQSLASRIQPYQRMQVWDACGPGRIEFDAGSQQLSRLGDIIEVGVLQAGLDAAIQRSAVERWSGAALQALDELADGQVQLRCEDGRQALSSLLVGADGRDSMVRKQAGIAVEHRDYRQSGLVAVLKLAEPHRLTARQAFTDIGPLGLLPLPDDCVSIVWSVPTEMARKMMALEEGAFLRQLELASGVGFEALLSQRAAFPLCLQHAQQFAAEQVALVGDAAHVVHPLAGLGMNLGFEDAEALVRHLASLKILRSPRARSAALQAYDRERKLGLQLAIQTIDGIDRLFGSHQAEVVRVRDLGLNLVDRLTPVKQAFMRYALGAGKLAA